MSQTPPFLRLELTQVRFCSFVLFFPPLDCVLRICKEMCDAPSRKLLDKSLAMSSLCWVQKQLHFILDYQLGYTETKPCSIQNLAVIGGSYVPAL